MGDSDMPDAPLPTGNTGKRPATRETPEKPAQKQRDTGTPIEMRQIVPPATDRSHLDAQAELVNDQHQSNAAIISSGLSPAMSAAEISSSRPHGAAPAANEPVLTPLFIQKLSLRNAPCFYT